LQQHEPALDRLEIDTSAVCEATAIVNEKYRKSL